MQNRVLVMSVKTSIRRIRRSRRRSAAAVEFALILPLLMTIVLACVDFGRFSYTYIAVTNGAREGAGFGSFHPVTSITRPVWEAQLRAAVEDEMGPAFEPNQITVIPDVISDGPGLKRVTVEVSYPFETLVSWPTIPHSMTLVRTVEMRVIR